jgi:hypothetical protein
LPPASLSKRAKKSPSYVTLARNKHGSAKIANWF